MREQRSYAAEAVILKQSDLGEADRILTLFTPYRGKMRVIAKGIRRPISKKGGHLELLCHSQLQIAVARNLDIITQAQTLENFPHLRSELWHMTCGFYFAELVERFIEDDTQHPDVYTLLLAALRALDVDAAEVRQQREMQKVGGPDMRQVVPHFTDRTLLLLRYFEIYLLSFIGYEPVLRTCANCHAELRPEENGFNASLGGALCPNCVQFWSQSFSMNALKVLRLLQRTEWELVPRFHLEARLHGEIEGVMHGLVRFHLERDLATWRFLDELKAKV